MRRFWLAGVICLLTAAALAVPALGESAAAIAARTGMAEEYGQAGTVMYVVNCNEWVSLRSSPSTSAARIAKVPLGAAVTDCQPATTTFTRCTYNGASGYVLTEYLSVYAPSSGGSDSYVGEMRVVNCNEWVSLRSGPSTSSSRIAKVPLGAVLMDCTRYSSKFVYGNYNGQWGYVLSEYLSRVPDQVVNGQGYVGDMIVVNCNEWVSLRAEPSTSASRVATVPLGATVSNCTWYSNNFICCEYNGMVGYILSSYLQPTGNAGAFGSAQFAGGEGNFTAVQPAGGEGNFTAVQPAGDEGSFTAVQPAGGEGNFTAVQPSGGEGNFTAVQPSGGEGNFTAVQPSGGEGSFTEVQPAGDEGSFVAVQPITGAQPQTNRGRVILEHVIGEHTVYAYYDFGADSEELYVECLNGQGAQVWNYGTTVPFTTELQGADAFVGGTADRPLVLVFNAGEGLYALDFYTGQVQWLVSRDTVNLGGGVCHGVGADGTVYIGGYYGPDPVAIDINGNVLWGAVTPHDAYWMHKIEVTDEGIVATYDCIDEHEAAGQITYGFDGTMLNVVWF